MQYIPKESPVSLRVSAENDNVCANDHKNEPRFEIHYITGAFFQLHRHAIYANH
jgi:hypothetical protein